MNESMNQSVSLFRNKPRSGRRNLLIYFFSFAALVCPGMLCGSRLEPANSTIFSGVILLAVTAVLVSIFSSIAAQ